MDIDQELIVTSSLDQVAKDLIAHSLLLHKEKGVKAYLACCLADVLRLYAPEAPYTEAEIKVSSREGRRDATLERASSSSTCTETTSARCRTSSPSSSDNSSTSAPRMNPTTPNTST